MKAPKSVRGLFLISRKGEKKKKEPPSKEQQSIASWRKDAHIKNRT
jgi:hypothetical protein